MVVLTDDTVFLPEKVLNDNQTTISKAYPGDLVIAKGGNTLAKLDWLRMNIQSMLLVEMLLF